MRKIKKLITAFATKVASVSGSPIMLVTSLLVIVLWVMVGPFMHYSDTWQLMINTSTTIVTFIIAISIQYTQNKDTKDINAKLRRIEKELDED